MFRPVILTLMLVVSAASSAQSAPADNPSIMQFRSLAKQFFAWRSAQQPVSGDDIPRVERPNGWVPDWSPSAMEGYREQYHRLIASLEQFETQTWPVSDQVDLLLVRAAVQRLRWELDILRSPHRNPLFYVHQTLGSLFELLLLSSPVDQHRIENLLLRMDQIPQTLKDARENLTSPVRPFAEATIEMLDGVDGRLRAVEEALRPAMDKKAQRAFHSSTSKAIRALNGYRKWLEREREEMQSAFAIGPDAYAWYLGNVALVPYRPDELLTQGRQAWNRAVAWDALEANRNRELPDLPVFETIERQIAVAGMQEQEIRKFLEAQDLMTVPAWLKHYLSGPLPAHMAPLAFMGVNDDLTSELRLDENAYRYIPEPSPDLPYFMLSAARDPRPLIIHEGVPGHYFQMALSWAHPNPIRRRYIDSSVNEGIAFYVEEMLLQAGLFDFSPRSREIIYSYSRLRALRVEVDIRLATGDFSIEQAAEYLARTVPMDYPTALDEAVFFAFNPGQAISYQVGKLQILNFLADARLDQGDEFSLRAFHDYLMQNGNVPIALQRWEFLGRKGAVHRLDALAGKPAMVPR